MIGARVAIVAAIGTIGACSIGPLDLTGKLCPCADGWTCDTATNTCVGGPADGPVTTDAPPDAPPGTPDGPPADARVDAVPGATCLGAAGAELLFEDFPDLIGWTTVGGTWSAAGSEAVQSSTTAQLAYAFPAGTSAFTNYRVTAEMRRTGGSGTMQAATRIQSGDDGQYHCNWNPGTGLFQIQWTRTNGNLGGTLTSITVDTSGIPGYDPAAPVTMEFQANGTQLACCLLEIPAATLSISDNRYAIGSPGIKTNAASAAFTTFRVNQP